MNRCQEADTFTEMLLSHEAFLAKHRVSADRVAPQDPDLLHTNIQRDLTQQIDHNLLTGVIVRADESHFRYSWRGCFFLWFQVVKEMIRA